MDVLNLEQALAEWRSTRHPDLAALVRQLSAGSPQPWPPDGGPSEGGGALLLAAFDRPPVDPRALKALHERVRAHAAGLRRLCPDPRIGDVALRVLTAGLIRPAPNQLDAARLAYRPVVELLIAAGDPTLAEAADALGRRPLAARGAVRDVLAELLPWAADRLREVLVQPLAPPVGAQVARQLRRTSRPSRSVAELWAEVVADPANDEALAVLGDMWLETGDPRGEVVTLERQRGSEKKVRAWYRAHRDLWLGSDLGAVLLEARGRGGVLVEGVLQKPGRAAEGTWEAAAKDERIATVRVLHQGTSSESHYLRFVTAPWLGALREADASSVDVLTGLAARPGGSLEVLAQLSDLHTLAERLATGQGLARVHTLAFRREIDVFRLVGDLERARVHERIRGLRLGIDKVMARGNFGPSLEGLLLRFAELTHRLPNLERLVGGVGPLVQVRLERRDGWRADVELLKLQNRWSRWRLVEEGLPGIPIPREVGQVRMLGVDDLRLRAVLSAAVLRSS